MDYVILIEAKAKPHVAASNISSGGTHRGCRRATRHSRGRHGYCRHIDDHYNRSPSTLHISDGFRIPDVSISDCGGNGLPSGCGER